MFKHYLTTALRHFRQHKVTTTINVVCLTIGLVCFLATYAVVTYLQSGDKHYPLADRIYMINWQADGSPVGAFGPYLLAKHMKADFPEIKTIARVTFDSGFESEVPIAAGASKLFAHIAYADPEFLDVFAFPFLSGDSRAALRSPRSAVLSKEMAVRLFGSVPNAMGQTLQLQDGRRLAITGVVDALKQPSHISTTGENNMGTVRFDVLVSIDVLEADGAANPAKQQIFRSWLVPYFFTYVVLPEDGSITIDALRSRLKQFSLQHAHGNDHAVDFGAWSVNEFWMSSMGALMGTHKTGIPATISFYFLGVIVLLISCINYANLATAQAATRAKEIGMRRVVGAHRGQIGAQFMLEAALQAFTALVVAVALIAIAISSAALPGAAAVVRTVVATPSFWLTLVGLLVLVTAASGSYPAFVLSCVRPIQAVHAGKRHGSRSMAQLLVGLQFSAASFLLISMLVMIDQNRKFKSTVLRNTSDTLVVVSNNVRAAGIDYESFRTELLRQPHVQAVTASVVSPWMVIAPSARVATSLDPGARTVTPTQSEINFDFFATLDIKLLAGRDFDREHANDTLQLALANGQAPNVVIDRALAETNGWHDPRDAIGKTLYSAALGDAMSSAGPKIVIGVVEDRPMSVLNPTGSRSNLYLVSPATAASPIVKLTGADPKEGLKEIETVWNRLAPHVALKTRFADETLARSYQAIEGVTLAFTVIATLALVISVLGLIGMSIQVIARRLHEIGVRKTLGASVRDVVQLLLVDMSKPVVIANVLAWPLAFVAMQLYLSLFTQRSSLSPLPFFSGLTVTVLIAWIAVAAQATRAARMNPATVLRYE